MRVSIEKVKSAEGGKNICLISSEKRVIRVTVEMMRENHSPSKIYKAIWNIIFITFPFYVFPRKNEHLLDYDYVNELVDFVSLFFFWGIFDPVI